MFRDELVNHMERKNLFTKSQHYFWQILHNSVTRIHGRSYSSTRQGKRCGCNLIWILQKPLIKVPHKRLLKKLSGYGIKGKVYKWTKEFLSNRKKHVVINGTQSEWRKVTSGITQESVLGTILFLIIINDTPEVLYW